MIEDVLRYGNTMVPVMVNFIYYLCIKKWVIDYDDEVDSTY